MPRLAAVVLVSCVATMALASPQQEQDFSTKLNAQIGKGRATLDGLRATTDFMKTQSGSSRTMLEDAESQIRANRPYLGLETLASVCPGIDALSVAAAGWGAGGKGIEALEKDWNAAREVIERDRKKFPARAPAGQSAFIRAIAELSLGQVQENYAAALDYGRYSGVEFGAYYLGRAQGHLAFALFSGELKSPANRPPIAIPSMAPHIALVDKAIVAAYAKPGSTTYHSNFIVANSAVKLARELESQGYRAGALVMLMRALFALGQTETQAPPVHDISSIQTKAEQFSQRIAADPRDHSIAEQYLQKAQLALEQGAGEGEAPGRARQRAALLLNLVLPRYFEIMEGAK